MGTRQGVTDPGGVTPDLDPTFTMIEVISIKKIWLVKSTPPPFRPGPPSLPTMWLDQGFLLLLGFFRVKKCGRLRNPAL